MNYNVQQTRDLTLYSPLVEAAEHFTTWEDHVTNFDGVSSLDNAIHTKRFGITPKGANVVTAISEESYFAEFQAADDPMTAVSVMDGDNAQTDSSTTFVETGVVKKVEKSSAVSYPSMYSNIIRAPVPEICDFLAKPLLVGTLAPTEVSNGVLATYIVGESLYGPGAQYQPHWEKLRGVYGIKFTAVYTLVVTADRFTAGLIRLYHLPTGGAIADPAYDRLHTHSVVQRSQLTSVLMDVNCDSAVELTIPYFTAMPFMVLNAQFGFRSGNPGSVGISVYSPVRSTGGVGSINLALYVHYTNVELYGNSIPQSGYELEFNSSYFAEPQAGRKVPRGEALQDKEMDTDRRISSGLSLTTKVLSALSSVPMMSTITTPLSWVTDALSRAAYLWGYSAPTVVTAPHRVVPKSSMLLANYNKHSFIEPLSLSVDNNVAVIAEDGGTMCDEMSIDFLKGISSYWFAFNWATSQTTGTSLVSFVIDPTIMFLTTTDGAVTLRNPTVPNYLCRLFRKFRGGFVLKFLFAKTEFHIGRMAITFTPGVLTTLGTYTSDAAPYAYREIVDIRNGNEFSISIPYIVDQLWVDTLPSFGFIGRVDVNVIDPLRIGTQGNGSINIVVESACGPDFQVAQRQIANYNPVVPTTVQSGYELEYFAYPQSGDPCEVEIKGIGSSQIGSKSVAACAASIGEVVESLSVLLKAGGITNVLPFTSANCVIEPYTYGIDVSTGAVITRNRSYDPYQFVGCCYALNRGGMRITTLLTTFPYDKMPVVSMVTPYAVVSNIVVNTGIAFPNLSFNAGIIVSDVDNSTVSFEVPQHTSYAYVPTWSDVYLGTVPYSAYPYAHKMGVNLAFVPVLGDGDTFVLYRAAKDDFRFSHFTSIPPTE